MTTTLPSLTRLSIGTNVLVVENDEVWHNPLDDYDRSAGRSELDALDDANFGVYPPNWRFDTRESPLDLVVQTDVDGQGFSHGFDDDEQSEILYQQPPIVVLVGRGDEERVISCRWMTLPDDSRITRPQNMDRGEDDGRKDGIVVRIEEIKDRVYSGAVQPAVGAQLRDEGAGLGGSQGAQPAGAADTRP